MPYYTDLTRFASRDEALLSLVNGRFESAKRDREWFHARCRRWYDMYRGWWTDPDAPEYRNNVWIPLIFSTIWSDVARKSNAAFGSQPYVAFVGYGQEDAPIARQQELLVTAQMMDSDTALKGLDIFLSGDLYGLGIIQTGWRKETMMVPERSLAPTPFGQQLIERTRLVETSLFDGPDWEPVDILDYFPQPRVPRHKNLRWEIRRTITEFDDLRPLAERGVIRKGALRELELIGLPEQIESDLNLRMGSRRNQIDPMPERFAKPVEVLEMVGFLPQELENEGRARYVITIANRKVVLRDRVNPAWHAQSPFMVFTPVVDPHHLEGPSKAELGEHLQAVAEAQVNARLDVLELSIDPPQLYDKMLGIDPENLYTRPGRWIGVDNLTPGAVQPLTPDLRGFQMSYQEAEYAWRWYQNASGIHEDAVMGAAGPDRETARGFLGRQAAVNTRLLLETRIFEMQILEPLANRYRALNRQFLPLDVKMAILGSNAITDPVTGLPVPQEVHITDEALNRDYNAYALGSSQVLPREARQQSLLALLQASASTPLMQFTNWLTFGRQIYKDFGFPNVDELLIPPQMQQLAMALAQQRAGTPAAAPNVAALPGLGTEDRGQPGGLEGTLNGSPGTGRTGTANSGE